METVVLLNTVENFVEEIVDEKCDIVRDVEHEHGKESEAHCLDTHMGDEIEFEDENETTFAAIEKMYEESSNGSC